MKTSDFYYDLPEELIAQTPIEPRNASRLMVLNKETGEVEHKIFKDLTNYLNPGDCLILNDTRVIPARIFGVKKETGAVVEFLLLKQKETLVWECLCKPGKKAKVGTEFVFGEGKLECKVIDVLDDGNRIIKFDCDANIYAVLDEIGQMPLPPYIKEKLADKERYQTVYSEHLGSAAAPTAGLHFTKEMLKEIEAKGVKTVIITDEYAGRDGASQSLADADASANAVVTGGNANMVINLPAMDKVIGYPEVADIIAGGFDGSLQKDGSIVAELQVITGATNEMGFNKLSAR